MKAGQNNLALEAYKKYRLCLALLLLSLCLSNILIFKKVYLSTGKTYMYMKPLSLNKHTVIDIRGCSVKTLAQINSLPQCNVMTKMNPV